MPVYSRKGARDRAREKLVGAINCTIPSFTQDLRGINDKAIRHDVALAERHGFLGTLGVCEVSITLPEYLDFLRVVRDEVVISMPIEGELIPLSQIMPIRLSATNEPARPAPKGD
ncbi:hypothetical protein GCM10009850_117720 [Nonomuraea monospora]|uniref:Uncharacterized protein n=1 Tax=Nonomuraea monospora TaxID=568818 RepID=A0ABN3D3C7_9ACTN